MKHDEPMVTLPASGLEHDHEVVCSLRKRIAELQAERATWEAECLEQARLNGMGAERELALRAERDRLLAMIEPLRRNGELGGMVRAPLPDDADDADRIARDVCNGICGLFSGADAEYRMGIEHQVAGHIRLVTAQRDRLCSAVTDLLNDLDDRALDGEPMPGLRTCMEAARSVLANVKTYGASK